jgi:hypothetical protein
MTKEREEDEEREEKTCAVPRAKPHRSNKPSGKLEPERGTE